MRPIVVTEVARTEGVRTEAAITGAATTGVQVTDRLGVEDSVMLGVDMLVESRAGAKGQIHARTPDTISRVRPLNATTVNT